METRKNGALKQTKERASEHGPPPFCILTLERASKFLLIIITHPYIYLIECPPTYFSASMMVLRPKHVFSIGPLRFQQHHEEFHAFFCLVKMK